MPEAGRARPGARHHRGMAEHEPRWVEVELHGGPLDGARVPVDAGDPDPGVPRWYAPDTDGSWEWQFDMP